MMSINLKNSLAALILATSSLIFASNPTLAQEAPDRLDEPLSIFDAFENQYFSNDPDFYSNRSRGRQIIWFFNLTSPENEIYRDGRAVNRIYRELLETQSTSTPVVRTPDLPNPYDTSLLTRPPEVDEFRDVRRDPIPPVPVPVQQPAAPPQPVPALW